MKTFLPSLLLIVGVSMLGYIPGQSDFYLILPFFSIAFTGYLLLYRNIDQLSIKYILLLGVLVRIVLIPAFPNLSDDIYRFYWDASLVTQGISPYAFLPSEILSQGVVFNQDIYDNLNSQTYYSIYPPLNQLIYYISASFSASIHSYSIVIKIMYLIIEFAGFFGIIGVLKTLGKDSRLSLLYILNPLVLAEGAGNLHIEVVMASFLSIGLYYILHSRNVLKSAMFYSLAIGVKLTPLLIAPYFFFRSNIEQRNRYVAYTVIATTMLFSPILLLLDVGSFLESVDLYFRKFEFNGSIYYCLRYLGKLYSGYNLIKYIGPGMGLITIVYIFYSAIKSKDKTGGIWLSRMMIAWTVYLFLSTTIHPWYIIPIILLSTMTDRRYPVLWSYLIFLTYVNYSYAPYFENLWVVFIEYLILWSYMVLELGLSGSLKHRKE